ncbi:MAG: lysozyme [Barnesiella sp.]|nr:lysozyme [Barnesiella sp.]
MELSQKIKSKIKTWEGCRLKAYRCPAGVLTIGYGHTGPDVTEGKIITQSEADRLFDVDIQKFAKSVAPLFAGVPINNNQFDALVSLSYNIGSLKAKAPTLLRKVRANPDDPSIRDEFMKRVNARQNGVLKRMPGLVKRRAAEADHYFG